MTRLGYQIPNFTYPDTRPDEIFDKVVAQARTAEAAGYDRVFVMDHFYQTKEAESDLAAMAKVKGWNDKVMGLVRKALIFGDADTVGERIAEAVAMGIDGITVDLPVNGHNLERVALLGEVSRKTLG